MNQTTTTTQLNGDFRFLSFWWKRFFFGFILWFFRRCHVEFLIASKHEWESLGQTHKRAIFFIDTIFFPINWRAKMLLIILLFYSRQSTNVLLFITNIFRIFAHPCSGYLYCTAHEYIDYSALIENNFYFQRKKNSRKVTIGSQNIVENNVATTCRHRVLVAQTVSIR